MTVSPFFCSFLSWYHVIPAAFLCFAPMKNQHKRSVFKTFLYISMLFMIIFPFFSYLESTFTLGYYALLPAVFILSFLSYHMSLRVHICKSLSIFALVVALMSFLANFANGYDAIIHPASTLDDFSIEAGIFQSVLTTAFVSLIYYPFRKFGSIMVDRFDIVKVWFISVPVSGIFLTYNLLIAPRKYETMYVNKVFLFYWLSLSLLLLLLILLCLIFYFIVSDMMKASEALERNRILEMQESAYLAQQRYLNDTAKARHDFKHTIGMLNMLVKNGDLKKVQEYLDEYIAAQPQNETHLYCGNTAVNALLNYYVQMAENEGSPIECDISMPESVSVSDIDLCSIIGNILENAIRACQYVPEDKRFIDMTIRTKKDKKIYIVATNSFDGEVKLKDGSYLSVRKHGTGIGLKSIRETADKYGGSARFSHEGNEFYTDIILP